MNGKLSFEELLALVLSETEANANATYGTSEPPTVSIPKLPPKTVLDLSQPTVNVPEIGEITVPPILSVAANTTAIDHPADLTQGDWLIVARNSRILYAYTMEQPPPKKFGKLDE